jgi:hypothetical protein
MIPPRKLHKYGSKILSKKEASITHAQRMK